MPWMKQGANKKRATKAAAVTTLGAAGFGLSLAGSAFASTMPVGDIPQTDATSPNQRFVLDEEEMADVSLATFHVFDRENIGGDLRLAAVVVGGCRGCGGCRACRGCRGCGGCSWEVVAGAAQPGDGAAGASNQGASSSIRTLRIRARLTSLRD